MPGIPRALGCRAYLSVWREVGALCVERLGVFVPSLPHPSAFHCVAVWQVPVLSRLWGQGAHGWVVRFCLPSVRSPSWNWLPIVVAPECLGHPTSIVSVRATKLFMVGKLTFTCLICIHTALIIIYYYKFFNFKACQFSMIEFFIPLVSSFCHKLWKKILLKRKVFKNRIALIIKSLLWEIIGIPIQQHKTCCL